MAVPNQKIVKVNKAMTDNNNLYTKINLSALQKATNKLTSNYGLALQLYFAKNQNEYTQELSSADFCAYAGCSRNAYNTAVRELIDKKFLIEDCSKKNKYNFYEISKE